MTKTQETRIARAGAPPRIRVLVVDDDEEVTELLAVMLTAEGYDVSSARSAELALEALHADHFRAVLKMRGTAHSTDRREIFIARGGLGVARRS